MSDLKLTYYGYVQDGTLKLSHRKRFDSELKAFEGKRVELTVRKARKSRSLNQSAYYWSVVIPCALKGLEDAGNTGLTKDDVHLFFKDRFILEGREIIIPGSGEVVTLKSTTTLSTTQMMGFIEEIARFCAEFLNIVIPEPSPLWPITTE